MRTIKGICSQGGGFVAGRMISVKAAKEFRPCLEICKLKSVGMFEYAINAHIFEGRFACGIPSTTEKDGPINDGNEEWVGHDCGVEETVQSLQGTPPCI